MTNSLRKKSNEIGISGINSISNLEAEIMKIIWDRGPISVREVHEIMLRKEMEDKEEGFIPYTTVMSTMTALSDKGLAQTGQDSQNIHIYCSDRPKRTFEKYNKFSS